MKYKIVVVVLGMTLYSHSNLYSQIKPDSKLTIRNAFEDPSDKALPAQASFTLPDTGKKSYLINLGVTYQIVRNKQTKGDEIRWDKFSPFVVFNRNNMISKEQFNYKAGLGYEYAFGKGNDDYNRVHFINITMQYLRDKIDSSHSLLATGYWSYLSNNVTHPDGVFFFSSYKSISNSSLFYFLAPAAGLEFQDIFQSTTDSTGFQARFNANLDGRVAFRYPTHKQKTAKVANKYVWPKLFELDLSYTARAAFINTVAHSDNYIPFFKGSITYFPTSDDNLSLALSYNNGADPVAGLAKQKFWQLAVQFQR